MGMIQPDTALATAFATAGYTNPLDALLREAWRIAPRSSEGRLACVQSAMRDRPALLWILLEQQNALAMVRRCVEDALADARERTAAARKNQPPAKEADAGGGQCAGDTQAVVAPSGEQLPDNGQWRGGQKKNDACGLPAPSPTTLPLATTPDGNNGRGHNENDTQQSLAPAVTSQFPTVRGRIVPVQGHIRGVPQKSLKQMADEQAAAMASRRATEAKYCILDTFLVNGVPIGKCAVVDVRSWANSRDTTRKVAARDVMFARSLAANLPGHRIIQDVWGTADADAAYARAERAAEASDVA